MPMSHLPGKSEIERRDREERRVPTISHLYLSSAFLVLVVFLAIVIWPLRTGRATSDLLACSWLYLRDSEPPARRLSFACDSQTVRLSSVEACRPINMPQTSRTGPFRTGAIDLTGDGVEEQVQLEEQQVVVYRDGVEVWRGLPEWRVVDLALGDPNDDGRSELVLALWKPDAAGVPRDSTEASALSSAEALVEVSHPFIIGYREGAYRILWGGSAVADPIREVELGDVDGDGVQELIVLEERADGRAVTVWRWHGWGFSLVWRSSPGSYQDLALIPSIEKGPLTISVAIES